MNFLIFDLETTGLANFRSPPEDPDQPRIVQLAGILCDQDLKDLESINVIIRPVGYSIPAESTTVHGITDELAIKFGIPVEIALDLFRSMLAKAGRIVAHNLSFDEFVLSGEYIRAGLGNPFDRKIERACTMLLMADYCRIPGKFGKWKWPALQEAYCFATGHEFEGAHDALDDTKACLAVYAWLDQQAGAHEPVPRVAPRQGPAVVNNL